MATDYTYLLWCVYDCFAVNTQSWDLNVRTIGWAGVEVGGLAARVVTVAAAAAGRGRG